MDVICGNRHWKRRHRHRNRPGVGRRVLRPVRAGVPGGWRPSFAAQEPRKMVFGEMLDRAGRVIDRGLAVRFPGPGQLHRGGHR